MEEHTCPTCGTVFETRRGLGVHHSTVHDERLPNRTCAECEDAFYSDYEKKYCSEDCRLAAMDYTGEANPNYCGAKESTTCRICGEQFEYYPSNKDGRVCPDCVETEDRREQPSLSGSDNPRWDGGKVTLDCENCDVSFDRYPSQIESEVALCSDDCRREWLSEAFRGDGHPNWKGGTPDSYGPGWNAVRREALERDGHECVLCATSDEDLGRNPDVDHITPVRAFRESENHELADAHHLDNVVTLCPTCHRNAEFGNVATDRLRQAISGQ